MKTIGGLALLSAIGIGLALRHCEEIDFFLCEIRPDGTWSYKGTASSMAQAHRRSEWPPCDELPPVLPGDSVMFTQVSHRILPVGFNAWRIDRDGTSREYSLGKARYYSLVWGLTLAPLVLFGVAFGVLVCVGRRVTP